MDYIFNIKTLRNKHVDDDISINFYFSLEILLAIIYKPCKKLPFVPEVLILDCLYLQQNC